MSYKIMVYYTVVFDIFNTKTFNLDFIISIKKEKKKRAVLVLDWSLVCVTNRESVV